MCVCSGGGISLELEDKRKKFQGKRKNQITDSSQLKNFPCKKFRKVTITWIINRIKYLTEWCRNFYTHLLSL